MAKEIVAKTVLSIVVAIIVIGSTIWGLSQISSAKAQVDATQDNRLGAVESEVNTIERRVDKNELKAAEELATKKAIFDTLVRMESAQRTMTEDMGLVKIDVAITKTQVENLERAE